MSTTAPPSSAPSSRRAPLGLVRAVATVGGYTLISRVTGFARDILIAAILGAGPLADAFFVAFRLPNFLRRLFAEGAFNAGFVPLFAGTLEAEGRAEARRFAEQAQAALVAALLLVVVPAILLMPWLIRAFAPGFEPGSVRFEAAVELTRVTFPYLALISLAALYAGVMNSLGRFAVAAAAPILLNLTLITALLFATGWLPSPAHALAWGVVAAGVLQLGWMVAAAGREGLALRPRRPRLSPEIRRLFALILPAALGAGVAQINLLADVVFASFLPPGAVSFLYYADRVNQLPLGVVGVAVGTALLPLLSRQIRAGDEAGAQASQNRALELALLLTVPAALALIVARQPIIAVLFERGAFGPAETDATAAALAAFALGLPAYVLIKVLTPGFFARQDTRTPVKIAVVSLITNIVLNVALLVPLGHVGIALATALSNWLNAGLLAWRLRGSDLLRLGARLRRRLPRILLASVAMAFGLWLLIPPLLDLLPGALALAALVAAGGLGFLLLAHVGGGTDLREIKTMLSARRA